jgi:hypothetical protein
MNYTIFDTNGNIICNYSGGRLDSVIDDYAAFGYVEGTYSADTHYYNVLNDSMEEKPPRPSVHHTHNTTTNEWNVSAESLLFAKNIKKLDIKKLATDIHFNNIVYDNKLLDSDKVSQENISGKIEQLKSEIEFGVIPDNLFWKDANNILHTWETHQEYLRWLQGLLIAISNRRTLLYQLSWQASSDIDSMESIEDVLNYDPEQVFQNI